MRKYIWEEQNPNVKHVKTELDAIHGTVKVNSIRGSKRSRENYVSSAELKRLKLNDPNIVGFDSSSSESDDDDEESEDDVEEEITNITAGKTENVDEKKVDENVESNIKKDVVLKPSEKDKPKVKKEEIKKAPAVRTPSVYVHVSRTKEIQTARLKLPILAEEQPIMEKINENSTVILAGETGITIYNNHKLYL